MLGGDLVDVRDTTAMIKRLAALGVFPAAATLLIALTTWWSQRAHVPEGAARYAVEADVLVVLTPSVVLYVLALPFVWRAASRASVKSVLTFSALAFALTLCGLALMMGPLYRGLSARNPTLADRAFFLVFPFAPVIITVLASRRVLRAQHGASSRAVT